MNAGNVQLISKSMVKPSSPTPQTQKSQKLSFFDQLAPPFYVPAIFFYPADQNQSTTTDAAHISRRLKQSFADALSLYPPLAGKLEPENPAIDCCDAGANFIEARVHANLSDATKNPDMEHLIKYLPANPHEVVKSGPGESLLAVQINFFDCGGFAVGVCSSHQVADAASIVSFMLSWAEISCRGQGENGKFTPQPEFDLARHFPARDPTDEGFSQSIYLKKEELVTKRLIFDREKLAALRRAASPSPGSGSKVNDPTRVELVSAFIWKNVIEIGRTRNIDLSAAWHVVNLRPRITSRQTENVFGNCILKKYIYSKGGNPEFPDLVSKLGKGLREIDEECVWRAGKGGYLDDLSQYFALVESGEIETCGFSSWCRFPVYEVDFGWGKPEWVCPSSCPEKNLSFMMGTKDGEGIEVWINMLESSYEHLVTKFRVLGNE